MLVGALAYAELLERNLAGDRLVPSLHDPLEEPGEVPGMGRVRAVTERRHPIIRRYRVAIAPHQRRVERKGPDRSLFVAAPLERGGRDDLEIPVEADERIGKNVGRAVGNPLVDRFVEVGGLIGFRASGNYVDLLIRRRRVVGQRGILGASGRSRGAEPEITPAEGHQPREAKRAAQQRATPQPLIHEGDAPGDD
jgi:hypothetical protein